MDGSLLAAAVCADRKAYEQIKRIGLKLDDLPEAAEAIIRAADTQYKRDANLTAISKDVLRSQIVRRFGDSDVAHSILDFAAEFPKDCSGVNVAEEYRLLRLRQVETLLAGHLATGQSRDQLDELLAKRSSLLSESEDRTAASWRLGLEDFEEDSAVRIPIAPVALNNHVGGGLLRGHNITVFGRPESGKSLFAINAAAFWISKGYRVLYVANEEPAHDITRRLMSNLGKIDIRELLDRATMHEAITNFREEYSRWFLLHKAGCTQDDIRRAGEQIKPDVIIVDQLKNVAVSEDNRALQLDKLARQVRELGIELGCVTMSVTQAGESGQNKPVLDLGDVEWSNTGIPGAADLMVGIGVDPNLAADNRRMLSVPKNKVSGKHGAFIVWVDPKKTMFMSRRNGEK